MTTIPLADHFAYVSAKKKCEYTQMLALGFPHPSQISVLPGNSIRNKVKNWCAAHWYTNGLIIQYFSDFVQYTAKEGKVSHAVGSAVSKEAIEAVFEFISDNRETLAHLKTAMEFKPSDTPFAPKVSKEVLEMSFAERQALLQKSNSGRLEEVK